MAKTREDFSHQLSSIWVGLTLKQIELFLHDEKGAHIASACPYTEKIT